MYIQYVPLTFLEVTSNSSFEYISSVMKFINELIVLIFEVDKVLESSICVYRKKGSFVY